MSLVKNHLGLWASEHYTLSDTADYIADRTDKQPLANQTFTCYLLVHCTMIKIV